MGISRINRAAPARAQSSEARSAILGQTPVATSSRFRGFLGVALAAMIVLTGASVFAGTSAAFAESTPSPAPPSTSPAPLPAPTITSPVPGTFVNGTSVRVQGTKAPGTSIQILAGPGQDSLCQVSGDAPKFDCVVPVSQSGRQYVLTAVQYGGGQTENQRASVTIQALMPPTVNPQSGTTPGPISGKGYPGATVTVASNGNVFATTTVTNAGTWGATIPDSTPSGTYNIQATQAFTPGGAASRPSTSVPIRVEIESIPAPTITSPTNGQSVSPANATYSGTGKDGLTVMVNAGNEQGERLVCTATVSGGRWSCSGAGMPSGVATLIALQTDGKNLPASSVPVSVNYGAASGSSGTPTAPGTPGSTPQAPGTKTPAPTAAPAPGSTATPAPAPATPGQTPGDGATPPGGGGGLQENGGTWADSTPFTNALQPTSGVLFTADWWRAVALAAGAIALLLVPARLLANIVAARISPVRRHGHGISHFTGRNRSAAEFDRAPELPSPGVWVTGAFGIVMTAILVMLANPIEGQPGYLRLLLASVIALLLVNAAGTLVPVVLARWWKAGPATIKLAPRYLIAVAAASALSRLLELQPAILFGLVFTVSLVSVIGAELRGKVALARIASVFSVGVVGWVATGLIGQPSGFWGALGSEVAGITAMAGVGSAAIMLIPLGQLSGRAIYSWSKPLWMAVTLMMFTALFLQLGPVIDSWQGGVAASVAVLLAVGFGAVSLSLWLWRRYVQPALR